MKRRNEMGVGLRVGEGAVRVIGGVLGVTAIAEVVWAVPGYWGAAAGATLALGMGVVAEHLRWRWAGRELARLVDEARRGEGPVEAVARARGPVAGIAGPVAEVLRDLKRQRVAVAELNEETRQRVKSRTDALEREIGTLKAKADRDGLTGLLNRRALDDTLPEVIAAATKERADVFVLMMDVDHFKQLNDTRGHAAGDEFLRSLGQLIRSSIRPGDLAFRHGGDEFVIVMPRAKREEAAATGERVRSLVDAFVKPMRCERPPRVSVGTVGLAEVGEKSAAAMLKAADAALYAVKGERRRAA